MNFKPDLIEALQDTVTNQSKVINALLVNRDLMRQLIDSQAKIIESLTKLKEKADNEVERLREEVRNWKKSFVGHVYVKDKDYAELISKRDALKTENERLREALKDIARQPEDDEDSAQSVAKAALRREDV